MIKHYLTNKGLLLLWILIFALSYSYSIELDNQKPKEYYKMTTKTIINQNTKQVKIVSINKIHYKYSDAEPVIFISNNKIIPTNEKKPICRITYNSELRFDFNELQIKKIEIYDIMGNIVNKYEIPDKTGGFTTDVTNLLTGPYFAKLIGLDGQIYILKFIK